jgi:CRP-like cAMP-binding protein
MSPGWSPWQLSKTTASRAPKGRPKNRLLRALPAADFQRLLPDLKTIPLRRKLVFNRLGENVEYVYFPNGGVISVTVVSSEGMIVETATVGVEGMLGIEAYLRPDPVSPGETMVQVPDTNAERLSVYAFRRELARQETLFDLIGRYAQTAIAQMMQSAACNALHHIDERCCRWLLLTHDRVGKDSFDLSQEFLAAMLGVRRQSVTVVAGTLQGAGLLSYKYGRVTILNRKGLESASCECYAILRRQFDDLRDSSSGSRS